MKRRNHTPRDPWKPLQQANAFSTSSTEATIQATMKEYNLDREAAEKRFQDYESSITYWINDLYQVAKRDLGGKMTHLNIRRRDGATVHDWRHLQRIKNELIGAECEAIELYPAESRLVDTSNKYHLWCITDPEFRFPIGFDARDVRDADPGETIPGFRQRPL